jgi:riboflavin kinase/FMN adenylyltransferase
MRVLRGNHAGWDLGVPRTALSVGVFDGVHRGHVRVLEELQTQAGGLPTAVLSFERHPLEIAGSGSPPLLTGEAQKLDLLDRLGIDIVGLLDFDDAMRAMSPEAFVSDVLVGGMRAALIVVGTDFRFGYQRSGDVETLTRLGQKYGFETYGVDLYGEGIPFSASAVREALLAGRVEDATSLLGRPYRVAGRVVPGDGRGRTIGVPTANLDLAPGLLIPAWGVYAVGVGVAAGLHGGVANIGVRPTFGGDEEVVEVHLFDFDADLYGQEITVDFVTHIRNERKFAGIDELVDQIRRDTVAARRFLAAADSNLLS